MIKLFSLFMLASLCKVALYAEPANVSPEKPMVGLNVEAPRSMSASEIFLDFFKLSEGWYTSCRYDWQKKQPIDAGCYPQTEVSCLVPEGETKDPYCDYAKTPSFVRTTLDTRELPYLKQNLDENLWIKSLPKPEDQPIFTYVTRIIKLPTNFKPSRLVLTYEGEGNLEVNAINSLTNKVVPTTVTKNRIEFETDGVKIIRIFLYKTNPENYVKNIKVFRKTNENHIKTDIFHPDYVKSLKDFDFLRYMTWTNVHDNFVENWEERSHIDSAQYTGYISKAGMPEELMINLANQTKTSMWLSIPAAVNDNYVHQYAKLVKNTLNRSSKVLVEYSNEMWNSIFEVSQYAKNKGIQDFNLWAKTNNVVKYAVKSTLPSGEVSYNFNYAWVRYLQSRNITTPAQQDLYLAVNYYAKRSVEICNIWKSVFIDQPDRVKCLLSSYSGVPQWGEETLTCPMFAESLGKPCYEYVEHFSVGPYFGHEMFKQNWRSELMDWVELQDKYEQELATSANTIKTSGLDMLYKELFDGGILFNKNAQGENLDKYGKVTTDPNLFVPAFPDGVMSLALRLHVAENIKLAKKYGKTLVAYEAGQHLIREDGSNRVRWDYLLPTVKKRYPELTNAEAITKAKEWQKRIFVFIRKAQNDPRMYEAYNLYLNCWKIQGGRDLSHFSGLVNAFDEEIYGLFDEFGQSHSPKYDALMDFKKSL